MASTCSTASIGFPAATLPSDGFFAPSDVVGSDIDSWKGTWVFGL